MEAGRPDAGRDAGAGDRVLPRLGLAAGAAAAALGLAARFVSGYLVQLAADQKSLDGPSGPTEDFTDLHAWAEVYIPGAGWIGLDPTSALFAGEGHIPLAATPHPVVVGRRSPAPPSRADPDARVRQHRSAGSTKTRGSPALHAPSSPQRIARSAKQSTTRLEAGVVRLTMGGEPTFVSVDDMTSPQWTIAADGPDKRELANELAAALSERYAPGGLVQRSQGKWLPPAESGSVSLQQAVKDAFEAEIRARSRDPRRGGVLTRSRSSRPNFFAVRVADARADHMIALEC